MCGGGYAYCQIKKIEFTFVVLFPLPRTQFTLHHQLCIQHITTMYIY